MLVEIRQRLIK